MNPPLLYGPVSSRRLGRSLGVNLFPRKICSLDCLYCEAGPTADLTLERKEWVPFTEVCKQLDGFLKENPELDYITFSGRGEPTLYSRLGELLVFLKQNYGQYKTAVLTNSTLLPNPRVREELMAADLLVPSLDAASPTAFDSLDKPHPDLDLQQIIQGIQSLGKEFSGLFWLEIFLAPGINTEPGELEKLRQTVLSIQPRRIHLNSLDRRAWDSRIQPLSQETLNRIASLFAPVPVDTA